jgi:hypothetical protein
MDFSSFSMDYFAKNDELIEKYIIFAVHNNAISCRKYAYISMLFPVENVHTNQGFLHPHHTN